MKILVTGATGFIGTAVIQKLLQDNINEIIAAVRKKPTDLEKNANIKYTRISNLDTDSDWLQALSEVDVVIHAAARVHITRQEENELEAFRKINVDGTLNLAKQAANAGVKRFIFISSIAVNGVTTKNGNKFTADDTPNPSTPYGISKYEAEQGLKEIAAKTNMELVIIRPPLVYGKNAKGNFNSLLKLVKLGIPLPFGSLNNKRSLVGIDNLVDFIIVCTTHRAARNQIFLVADSENLSTAQLIKEIYKALGKHNILLPFPEVLLKFMLKLIGKKETVERIFGALQIDISKNKQLLGWTAPISIYEGIKRV